MERRQTPRKDWIVGKDDVGRAVLEWAGAGRAPRGPEKDPSARTYDFLNKLDSTDLSLAPDASRKIGARGMNPYDTERLYVREKDRD